MEKRYRHEWKYEISMTDMLILRSRLVNVMEPDPHASGGQYFIRSLYFDNLYDKALREKTDGVNGREKYRIRYYDHDLSLIHLEKKSKINGLGTKYSSDLTESEAQKILEGDTDWMMDSGSELIKEFCCKMKYQGLRPVTIVDYVREPFIYGPGNVRVTIDHDIRTGLKCTDFLDPEAVTIPVPDDPILLEIKWDDYLPDIIKQSVQLTGRRTEAFSKYAQSRMYD